MSSAHPVQFRPFGMANAKVFRIAVIIAALVALIAAWALLPLGSWVMAFRDWVVGLGPLGWMVFVLVYAVAVTALLPAAPLTLAAGFAYGLWGFPIVVLGATAGASAAFLAARVVARARVRRFIETRPRFKAVDKAVAEGGWKIVALLRLSPALPFSAQNWLLGATSVGFLPYVLATFFGIMPGTLLYVWIGDLGGMAASAMMDGSDDAAGGADPFKYGLIAIGVLATAAVTWFVSKKAREKLTEAGVGA